MAYELLLLSAVLWFASLLFLLLFGSAMHPPLRYLLQLWLTFVAGSYFVWCWTHGGQTLPMKTWRLRLVAADGFPPGWRVALLRFICAMPSLLTGLGIAWALFDREGRFWHDRMANTRIMLLEKQGAPKE